MQIVDHWTIFDNSWDKPNKVAFTDMNGKILIINENILNKIKAVVYAK